MMHFDARSDSPMIKCESLHVKLTSSNDTNSNAAAVLELLETVALLDLTICKAYLHAWSGCVWQLNSSTETLVLLGVIVFQSNLYARRHSLFAGC